MAHLSQESFDAHAVDVGGGEKPGVRAPCLVARVTERHELITSGPYAVVRHPIYTAMLGLLIATGLTFGTPTSTVAGAVLYVIGTWLRTRAEERLLEAAFGDRYAAYRRRVPALIPWPRPR